MSERLSALSLCSFSACCKARISALCSFTASSTAWRDSVLRWSARNLSTERAEEGLSSQALNRHCNVFEQALGCVWKMMCMWAWGAESVETQGDVQSGVMTPAWGRAIIDGDGEAEDVGETKGGG